MDDREGVRGSKSARRLNGEDVTVNLRTIRALPLQCDMRSPPVPSVVRVEATCAGRVSVLDRRMTERGQRPVRILATRRRARCACWKPVTPAALKVTVRHVDFMARSLHPWDDSKPSGLGDFPSRTPASLPLDRRSPSFTIHYAARDSCRRIDGTSSRGRRNGRPDRSKSRPRWAIALFARRKEITVIQDIVVYVGRRHDDAGSRLSSGVEVRWSSRLDGQRSHADGLAQRGAGRRHGQGRTGPATSSCHRRTDDVPGEQRQKPFAKPDHWSRSVGSAVRREGA